MLINYYCLWLEYTTNFTNFFITVCLVRLMYYKSDVRCFCMKKL